MSDDTRRPVRRALVSVYDKSGLEELALGLAAAGVEMVSTGSTAKTIAAAISDSLGGASLSLARGRLVSLRFQRASARRIDEGEVRRIDLTFRARIEL